jgi:hypothetical protein
VQELIAPRQEGSVEEYTKEFEVVQYQVSMFNLGYDDMFFTSHYVNGLKGDIKGVVQSQMPESVDRASMLAKVQQQNLERSKTKHTRFLAAKTHAVAKSKGGQNIASATLWKER